jgi:hypothetical protein
MPDFQAAVNSHGAFGKGDDNFRLSSFILADHRPPRRFSDEHSKEIQRAFDPHRRLPLRAALHDEYVCVENCRHQTRMAPAVGWSTKCVRLS